MPSGRGCAPAEQSSVEHWPRSPSTRAYPSPTSPTSSAVEATRPLPSSSHSLKPSGYPSRPSLTKTTTTNTRLSCPPSLASPPANGSAATCTNSPSTSAWNETRSDGESCRHSPPSPAQHQDPSTNTTGTAHSTPFTSSIAQADQHRQGMTA